MQLNEEVSEEWLKYARNDLIMGERFVARVLNKGHCLIPSELKNIAEINAYAVQTRYPGHYEPIDENEYRAAYALAAACVLWSENIIANETST